MASNFKILTHRNDENIHLKLMGDFDGSSAHELLHKLRRCCPRFAGIFVHTECLKKVEPFGVGVLRNNLNEFNKKQIRLVFTGGNAAQFSS